MSQDHTKSEDAVPDSTANVRHSFFFRRLERDVWESWAWTSVGLFCLAVTLWAVAYLRLGYLSVYAYGVGIPMTLFFAGPITAWGMLISLLRPPVFRRSRTIAFACLLATAIAGNAPLSEAPVSTWQWTSKHTYSLPFSGEWYTMAGGRTLATNSLASSPAQRFGYSFTVLKDGARASKKEANKLTDYYCYGAPVLAPVDATVVAFENAILDNTPGKDKGISYLGNHLVLKVDEGEFVFIMHLKKGSVLPQKGSKVTRGQVIGQCGNSGLSSYPHVHISAQNTDKPLLSEGLPILFSDYVVEGKGEVKIGMPLGTGDFHDLKSGQTVRSKVRSK